MFSTEAVTQVLTIWLGSAAAGLAFALLIALFTPRSERATETHGEQETHGHDDHGHDEVHH
ncbi:MAG TPA: hypothetical protein PLD25_14125 [Chloroflexota bacterium]|nr:hypothetical protein [Chloroflexota bacterium]HUM71651.1 hypothetical protein [Chloroflexota bacterium]